MKTEQVDHALHQKFLKDGARIVFWHDPKGDFADYVGRKLTGEIKDVEILQVDEMGGLPAKLRLEKPGDKSRFLVYSKEERPPADEDWLLDIRLYSAEFHADLASIWIQELGLDSLSLRDHLNARAPFFRSRERRAKLAKMTVPTDDDAALDLKMLAVLVKSDVASPFDVLKGLCHSYAANGSIELSTNPDAIELFEKMGLIERFWELMQLEFGYSHDNPTVAGLLRCLFISELAHQTGGKGMDSLVHHVLPPEGQRNAVVFLTQWRDSSTKAVSYDAAASAVAIEQKVSEPLGRYELDTVRNVYTFPEAEKAILSRLSAALMNDAEALDLEMIRSITTERRAGHWLSGPGSDSPERQAIADSYDAIVSAAELFTLQMNHGQLLDYETPSDLLNAYQDDLFQFDQLYRSFCTRTRASQRHGWELLKNLTSKIERVYGDGFLQPFGIEWSRILDAGFLEQWSVDGLSLQRNFYKDKIRPHLADSDRKRAFVIISDAFRYEAAHELASVLNGKFRMDAKLSAMLGVLPSYTALGMASLLPHTTLGYGDRGEVLVDGKPTAGTEARSKQLAAVKGMACQADKLIRMKLEEAREFTKGKRVVYIYHNVIDARGDSASTEGETFEAVSACIAQLVELVHFCVNKLNAGKVWVTADHGFLFQQSAPDITDKSKLSAKPSHAVTAKKRYVIGRDLGATPEAHHGTLEVTAGAEGGMEFWVPRAGNLFHFAGGARFVHGGAMPQEVVVPLVTVTELRGKAKERSRSEKVSVQVLGTNHKITTPTHRFELIQTDAVSSRTRPVTIRAAIYDGPDAVTSVETVTFDSTSDSLSDRKKSLRFELRSGTYDRRKPYRLVLRDAESDAELQAVPVVIDRSFEDDF